MDLLKFFPIVDINSSMCIYMYAYISVKYIDITGISLNLGMLPKKNEPSTEFF